MFLLTTISDTIRIPARMLSLPTLVALQSEIDRKYPNRVLMDVGLVIGRHGDCLKISSGVCVPGDGGSHHECLFQLVVFRPFVEEVCVGRIVKSTPEGIQVSLGFFQDIRIPAYWMLRPSHYDESIGLWVWTPNYDDDDDDEEENETVADDRAANGGTTNGKKSESSRNSNRSSETKRNEGCVAKEDSQQEEGGDRFEMEIGAEIRFKVKSIHFTQVTNTAKGMQATTTTTAHSHTTPKDMAEAEEKTSDKPLRKRSTSVDLSDVHKLPPSMHIVASICEDGLGLTSWWTGGDEEEEEEEEIETED